MGARSRGPVPGGISPRVGSRVCRHRAIEFEKFLSKISTAVPEHLDVHLVRDDGVTRKSPHDRGLVSGASPMPYTLSRSTPAG